LLCVMLVACAFMRAASAQDSTVPDDRIVATVDGQPIYAREVERELARVVGKRKIEPAALTALREKARSQLVDRRLILAYLADKGLAASSQDIDLAIGRVRKQLAQQEVSLEDYVKDAGMSMDEFRHTLNWQISWRRYLQKFITDDNLQRYFDKHRRQFDGTEIRVAHVLFKVTPRNDEEALSDAIDRAEQVRQQVVSGELSFTDAARERSDAPTGANGGDIGFITRHQPMPEPFSQAAFALDKGQTSQPVVSPVGVHLIQCLEIKPGKKTWQGVRTRIVPAVTLYLFEWVADQQRPNATIEINE
ncbi:MAG: peptidylprolyl isomerase, partial [Pirellulaceae bacterium]|nr:peptidylprolyl isomerase [Pirellulaceae bacterium]